MRHQFHGPSEGHPPFDLKRDIFGHELRIDLRFPDFLYVNQNFMGDNLFDLLFEQ
jgi:hypothetical protein